MRAKTRQSKKKKGGIILKILLFGFVLYSAASLIKLSVDIRERRSVIDQLKNQIEQQTVANEQLKSAIERGMTKEDVMKISRDKLGLASPEERVFINIDGQ